MSNVPPPLPPAAVPPAPPTGTATTPPGTPPSPPMDPKATAMAWGVLVYYGAILAACGYMALSTQSAGDRAAHTARPAIATPPTLPEVKKREAPGGAAAPADRPASSTSSAALPVQRAPVTAAARGGVSTKAAGEEAPAAQPHTDQAGASQRKGVEPGKPLSDWVISSRFVILILVIGAGAGCLHGLASLAVHSGNRDLALGWWVFYVTRPVLSAGIALVTSLVLVSGVTGVQVAPGRRTVVLAWAALAGLFAGPAMDRLRDVFNAIFRSSEGGKGSGAAASGIAGAGGTNQPAPPPPPSGKP